MNYAVVYIVWRFLFRVVDFFHHWYIDASRRFLHGFFSLLSSLDYTFAVHLTLRHFFEPLYKDYSMVGRILGIVFRSGRVIIGGSLYLVLCILFIAAYTIWLLTPVLLLLLILRNIPVGEAQTVSY